jgi:hypothetical protein
MNRMFTEDYDADASFSMDSTMSSMVEANTANLRAVRALVILNMQVRCGCGDLAGSSLLKWNA